MGTKRQRGPRTWQLRVANGTDPLTGRRRTVTETFHGTETAADIRLAALVTKAQRGPVTDYTLDETITAWRAQAAHELGTARNYDLAYTVIPAKLLGTKITKIRAATIAELVATTGRDRNVHRARLVHAIVSGALTYAWRMEWIHDNPARRVPIPPVPARAHTQPTVEGVRALLELVIDDVQLTAWLLASADMGSRRQETLALRWSNVRLTAGEIHIADALDPIDGHLKTTKTKRVRTVAIGDETVVALTAWHDAMVERAAAVDEQLGAGAFVFSDALDGMQPWRLDTATKRFGRLRNTAGLTGVRLYDLRHFVATELLEAGMSVKLVAERLGHSRTQTTQDIYAGVTKAQDRAAADELARRRRAG